MPGFDSDVIYLIPPAGHDAPENQAIYKLNNFFNDEERLCQQVKNLAELLIKKKTKFEKVYKKAVAQFPPDLKSKYKEIDSIILLYENLSKNCFEMTEAQKQFTIEEKFQFILQAIKSDEFDNRIQLLSDAARIFTPLYNSIYPFVRDNEEFTLEEQNTIGECLGAPMQRIPRICLTLQEVKKYYQGDSDNLKRIVLKFTELTGAANQTQVITDPSKRAGILRYALTATITNQVTSKYTPIKIKDPSQLTKFWEEAGEEEHQQEKEIVTLFKNRYTNKKINTLKIQDVLSTLKDYSPTEKLEALEEAFTEIGKTVKNENVSYFFRKNFHYTKVQLKDIKILKDAYLEVVKQTPYKLGSDFEQYLEKEYEKNQKANEKKLLGFNRTTFSGFIKPRTTSMRKLEELKVGMDRC